MTKRRKLSDLYVRGIDLSLDDGQGDPINVWVQKLNPIEHETALRKANAYRARTIAGAQNPESDLYQSYLSEAEDFTHDQLVDYLVAEEMNLRHRAIESEIEHDEQWNKDDYLQSIRDAWEEGLSKAYALDPEDPEASRVYDELTRFVDQVEKRATSERQHVREDLDAIDDDRLRERVVKILAKNRSDIQWMAEFRRCQLWQAVRDPENHKKRYFEALADVYDLAQPTLMQLIEVYNDLEVESLEGKGSPESPDSSSSSEPANPPETEPPSSQAA